MVKLFRRRLFFPIITVFLAFMIAFPTGMALLSIPRVRASDWAGWDAINTIYYNPTQEDAYNPYLATAAGDLETYLEQMSGKQWNIVTNARPSSPAIYLTVNAAAPALSGMGEEAFHLVSDASGITITGHTALAVRHGAYDVLDRLGVRWFFKNTAWTVVPDSLADLGALDATDEPDFFWRGIRLYPYQGQADTQAWERHNRAGGAAYYWGGHSYEAILDEATGFSYMTREEQEAFWNAHPSWFLPASGYDNYPWQLNPADPNVIQMSKDYAATLLAAAPVRQLWYCGDKIPIGAVSITPNDGGGWNPPYNDNQAITDLVFSLTNAVADSISSEYPERYVTTPSYAQYSYIPSIELAPNVLVHVSTAYNYSDYTIVQRIAGIAAQGAVPGIRDYVDIWQWFYDAPGTNLKVLQRIPLWESLGAQSYEGEAMDNWGGRGHIYYALSRLLWDSSLDLNDILDDFYTKAFGPAAATMKMFYETRGADDGPLAESFRLLSQAQAEAAGDSAVLTRIRQLECYTYFVWKFDNTGITNLSNAELENFYTFLTKIRDWYLVTYDKDEENIASELSSRGYSAGQINALRDFNTPTDSEVAAWMNEALSVWRDYSYTSDEIRNPLNASLVAFGDTDTPAQTPITCENLNILVPSNGNEDITVRYKGEQGTIMWYDSSGMLINYYQFSSPVTEWTTIKFHAYDPDIYVIHIPYYYTDPENLISNLSIDLPGRTAAILASPNHSLFSAPESPYCNDKASFYGSYAGYFFVPDGTDSFTLGYAPWESQTISGMLTDPNGHTYNFSCVGGGRQHGDGGSETTYDSPVAGLWKIQISTTAYSGYFWFNGILPLVWNDPEYLAVEAVGPPAPPVLNHIGDKTVGTGQLLRFTISATDPNGDHLTYSASNLPPWATFNAATRTFSGTPNQAGSYNVHFQVSDGSLTDSEDITINAVVYDPDVNNDGVVNILDIIGVIRHWNETGTPGWIMEDVNIDGIINILDIALIGQYWS